jgi:hypothetical protein
MDSSYSAHEAPWYYASERADAVLGKGYRSHGGEERGSKDIRSKLVLVQLGRRS